MDEFWIHLYPGNKNAIKTVNWTPELVPKKANTMQLARKVMASVFWYAKEILIIDYLEKRKTVTSQCYTTLLNKLKKAILEKGPWKGQEKGLFHHDNSPAHSSATAETKIT